jgi:hypothetical protein
MLSGANVPSEMLVCLRSFCKNMIFWNSILENCRREFHVFGNVGKKIGLEKYLRERAREIRHPCLSGPESLSVFPLTVSDRPGRKLATLFSPPPHEANLAARGLQREGSGRANLTANQYATEVTTLI